MKPTVGINLLNPPRVAPPNKANICLVTPDILGPIENGGVGTACFELAKCFALQGHGVTVLFVPPVNVRVDKFKYWQERYLESGIALVAPKTPSVFPENHDSMKRSYCVYEHLKQFKFDLVLFPDMSGLGYYSFLAKKTQVAFSNTVLALHAHGPNSWHREFNRQELGTVDEVIVDFLEKKSFEFADAVTIAHDSFRHWLNARNWKITGKVAILPLPCSTRQIESTLTSGDQTEIREIVFFGRLELRKGVCTFCDAIDVLAQSGHLAEVRITFLGKTGDVQSQNGLSYVKERSKRWPTRVQFLSDRTRTQALNYLSGGGKLAVLPSQAETFGYALEECFQLKIPFLVSDLAVFKSRIAKKNHDLTVFDGSPEDLAKKTERILAEGWRPKVAVAKGLDATESWQKWLHQTLTLVEQEHAALETDKKTSADPFSTGPLVSICLTHRNRPVHLHQAIDSLKAQSYPNFEVVIIDDGSDSTPAISFLKAIETDFPNDNWQLIRNELSLGPGACRNQAAEVARGHYLLFMDDDNIAKPDEIAIFVRAALKTKADIVTCFFDRIDGAPAVTADSVQKRWLSLGPDLSSGFLDNVFGDMNALVRKSAFFEIGKINEERNVGCEDWEFFARAVAKGYSLWVVPEALFYYRDHPGSYSRRIDRYKSRLLSRSVYSGALPPGSLTALMSHLESQIRQLPAHGKVDARTPVLDFAPYIGPFENENLYEFDERLRRIFIKMDTPGSFDSIAAREDVKATIVEQGLALEVNGNDPQLLLPALNLLESQPLLIEIDIESPVATELQVFHKSKSEVDYGEEKSIRAELKIGKNYLRIGIEVAELQEPIRIDPGNQSGTYILSRLVVRGE